MLPSLSASGAATSSSMVMGPGDSTAGGLRLRNACDAAPDSPIANAPGLGSDDEGRLPFLLTFPEPRDARGS